MIVRRDHQGELEDALALIREALTSGARLLEVSVGVGRDRYVYRALSLDAALEVTPSIHLDIRRITVLEVASLLVDLAQREIVDLIMLEGARPELALHLSRLRWVFARFRVCCVILADCEFNDLD